MERRRPAERNAGTTRRGEEGVARCPSSPRLLDPVRNSRVLGRAITGHHLTVVAADERASVVGLNALRAFL